MRGRRLLRCTGVVVVASVLWVLHAGVAGAQAKPSASCSTFNAQSEPSSRFSPSERIIIRGTGFGPRSLVLINLQQGTRSVELARATANDLGAFRVTDAQIPATVAGGKASIRALDAKGSAVCTIGLTGATADSGGLGFVYAVWGGVLLAFGVFLGVVTYKRWKAAQLDDAIEQLSRSGPLEPVDVLDDDGFEADDDDDDEAFRPRPERVGARRNGYDRRGAAAAEPDSEDGPDDASFAEEWAFAEHLPAGWVRSDNSARNGARFGFDEEEEDEADDDDASIDADADDALHDPPLLPIEPRDRSRDARAPSEAIERLRREVRAWDRS